MFRGAHLGNAAKSAFRGAAPAISLPLLYEFATGSPAGGTVNSRQARRRAKKGRRTGSGTVVEGQVLTTNSGVPAVILADIFLNMGKQFAPFRLASGSLLLNFSFETPCTVWAGIGMPP